MSIKKVKEFGLNEAKWFVHGQQTAVKDRAKAWTQVLKFVCKKKILLREVTQCQLKYNCCLVRDSLQQPGYQADDKL